MAGSTTGTESDHSAAAAQKEQQTRDNDAADAATALEDAAPDGGFRAWSVVTGAAFIFFSVLGFSNSFGVFEEYYLQHQLAHRSPDDIAWIGSLAVFLQLSLGAVSGPLFDRFGAWILRPAIVLYIVSLMLISVCKEYWHFMLAQGLLLGASQGFLTLPAMAAVSQHFSRRRATALGLSISGSSIGGVVFPLALSRMLNASSLGFGWSVRVVAFVNLPLLCFAAAAIRSRLPPRRSTFFVAGAFRNPTYDLLIVGMFAAFFGMFMPLFYMPTYAVSRGMSPTLASYLLAILNAASTFGRVIPGVLADKFGKLNIFALAGLLTGVIAFCFTKVETNAGLIVYSVFVGFTSGAIMSGAAAAFTLCLTDMRQLGTYMGMAMALASVSSLIGGPVDGAFIKHFGGFWEMSVFTGAMCLFSGFVTVIAKTTRPEGLFGRV